MVGTLDLWFELQSPEGCLHNREGNGECQSVTNSQLQRAVTVPKAGSWDNICLVGDATFFWAAGGVYRQVAPRWALLMCPCSPVADTHYLTCRIQECSETKRSGPFSRSIDVSSLVVQDEYIFIQVPWLHTSETGILSAQGILSVQGRRHVLKTSTWDCSS